MNPKRWTPPVSPALIVAIASLAGVTASAYAQSVPDAATLSKYDTNRDGVLDATERAAMDADRSGATTAPQTVTSSPTTEKEDVLKLTPFQVDASRDRGYFSENTLAGSRMRTNLADLGSSISVVNKALMEDTGSFDINDVFRFEADTEGASTYTPGQQAMRGDGILDVNAGGTQGSSVSAFTVAGANRVRGLDAPNMLTNYYPSITAVRPDRYNVQSFEISRGPNSFLFALGSPAGGVNTSTSQAVLNRDNNKVELIFDDRGSHRESFSFNRSIIKDKVAVFGAVLYRDDEFTRKPSYDITRRAYGAITIKPFKKTLIQANVEDYSNSNRRPNTLPPTDFVTQWRLAGRPTYDALSKKVTFLSNGPFGIKAGDVRGPYISNSGSYYAQQVRDFITAMPGFDATKIGSGQTLANFTTYGNVSIYGSNAYGTVPYLASGAPSISALYVPGITEPSPARTIMQIQGGQLYNWVQSTHNTTYNTGYGAVVNGAFLPDRNPPSIPAPNSTNNPALLQSAVLADPTWADVWDRDFFYSTGWTNIQQVTNLAGATYRYPEVTDRSIYDWKKVNMLASNFGRERNVNYNVELQQEITKDLFFNAGWFRQDFDQFTNYTIAQLNATTLRIDINKYLPDGTPNPFFLKPLVYDFDPDRYIYAELDDHFRAQLGYSPDFTQKNNWMKWLGRHQMLGAWLRDEYMTTQYRQRFNYVGAGSAMAAYRYLPNPNADAFGRPTGWHYTGGTALQRFYYLGAPGDPNEVVSRSQGAWDPLTVNDNIRVYDYLNRKFDNANVTASFINFDSPARTQRMVDSKVFGDTSYLWKDRIVITLGDRADRFKARNTTTGAIKDPITGATTPALTNIDKFDANGYFNTDSMWNRFTPPFYYTFHTKSGGGVFRPFRGWSSIDRLASHNLLWEGVRNFGFGYNWADNNNIPGNAQVDYFGNALPKPRGAGRDISVQTSLFDDKLFAKVTWFRNAGDFQSVNPGTVGSRQQTLDVDIFRGWARTIALINMGQDPRSSSFGQNLSTAQEDQVESAVEKIWGLPYDYFSQLPGTLTYTQSRVSTGIEAQLNYNARNWRNRFTFSKKDARNYNVLKEYTDWYNIRSKVWMNAKASDYLLPQYQSLDNYSTSGGTQVRLTSFWNNSYGYNSNVTINNAFGWFNPQAYYDSAIGPQLAIQRDLEGQSTPGLRKYSWSYVTSYDFTSGYLKGFTLGGSERWESKSIIGYYGKPTGANTTTPNLLELSDTTRPIYDKANSYTDLWIAYKRKVWNNRINMTVQLNVENVFESGHLQAAAANFDGSPYAYRIVDPRKFSLRTTFDF